MVHRENVNLKAASAFRSVAAGKEALMLATCRDSQDVQRRAQPYCGVLRKVYREAFEIGEGAVSQSSLMSGAQDHTRRLVRLERFLPARCT
jgi:hypothetical protein